MKQRLSRGELVFWSVLAALALINVIVFVLLLPTMPDHLPSHWGISGAVDGWSDKEVTIVLAAMPLVFVALLFIVPRIDPKRHNFASFSGIYRSFTAAICLLLIAVTWMGPFTAWGYLSPDSGIVSTLLFGFFGLLFIGLGNYMPRIRPNFTFGIRTPWTLASEEVWRSTHRASGAGVRSSRYRDVDRRPGCNVDANGYLRRDAHLGTWCDGVRRRVFLPAVAQASSVKVAYQAGHSRQAAASRVSLRNRFPCVSIA